MNNYSKLMTKVLMGLTVLISSELFSQAHFNTSSFEVTKSDLEINKYEKDTTASALVIYEQGKTYVHSEELNLRTEEKHKVKIFNRDGYYKADIILEIFNNGNLKEKITDIEAATHNLINDEIKIDKLNKENIYVENYNENYSLIKFTLPNLKPGSVITYSFTRISPFFYRFKGWTFQDDIPKVFSEYRATIPGFWEYNTKLLGSEKLSTNTSVIKKGCIEMAHEVGADCSHSVYAMKNIPAFIEEYYITTKNNYLARLEYELKTFKNPIGYKRNYTRTWKDVDKKLKNNIYFGKRLQKKINIKKILPDSILNVEDSLNKAKSIHSYVKNNYVWNNYLGKYPDATTKELIKTRSGNASSLNIFLHNLLKESGINVNPVLVSTRDNGFATKAHPVLDDFNYLLIHSVIEKDTFLLDATDKYLSFGDIPHKCLNYYGRLLDFKNSSRWVDLKSKNESFTQYTSELTLNSKNIFKGKVVVRSDGYNALNSKTAYYNNKSGYIEEIINNSPNLEISNYQIIEKNGKDSKFIETYDVEYPLEEEINGLLYISPFFNQSIKKNPFQLLERKYPVDFGYKSSFQYRLRLNIDTSYEILEYPKSTNLTLPNDTGQILQLINIRDNSIQMTFKISFALPIYVAEYYPYLKEFMSKAIDIQTNSLIVLKKK